MSRKLRSMVIVVLAAIMVIALMVVAAPAQEYRFRLGHVLPASHPYGVAMEQFAKAVEQDSGGRIKIQVVHGGALGGDREMGEQIRLGGLEMGLVHTTVLGVDPRLQIEELPFAWARREQAYAALDGELGAKLLEILSTKGIKGLAWYENGYRNLTNNVRPIREPSDLKGLKIRMAELKMRIDTFKLLGANPIPMAFPELFTALQQGTVDGQENPLAIIKAAKFYEVQKYLSLSGHIWGSVLLMINKNLWEKLPADLQNILMRNAIKYRDIERKMIQESDETTLVELKKTMQVNEVDKAAFRKAVAPIYESYRSVFGDDLMKLVEKYGHM
jgi:tripartite ATP-independent transporter DctP family solute receptor